MKKTMIITIAGLLLLTAGLILTRALPDAAGIMRALPYIMIGVGCGVFGHGMGDIIGQRAARRDPAMKKKQDIERSDERNSAISDKAKAKAYDMMVFVFGALMVALALMGTDMATVLLLVLAYICVVACRVYYGVRYEKEM